MRVLAIDGRGVPGLAVFPVLQALENALAVRESSISAAFDWIVGTSVGGIIAVALRDEWCVRNAKDKVIALLRDEFEESDALSCLPTRFVRWRRARRHGHRYAGIMLDARIFDRFLAQTMPPGTAVTVYDHGRGANVALTNPTSVRTALCGTMAEATFLPAKKAGTRLFSSSRDQDDPLPAFAQQHPLDGHVVLSIGIGAFVPTVSTASTTATVRWQVPTPDSVAFDDTRRIRQVMDTAMDMATVAWNGVEPHQIADWLGL